MFRKSSKTNAFIRRFVAFFIFISMLLLVSCSNGNNGQYNGIDIQPIPQYSYDERSLEYAEELLYTVLYAIEFETSGVSPNSSKILKLQKAASESIKICANGRISENKLLSSVRCVYENRLLLASVIAGKEHFSRLNTVYAILLDYLGEDYLGEALYGFFVYMLETSANEKYAEYEKSGEGYLLVLANRYESQKNTLVNSIGRKNVLLLLDYALFASSLMLGDVFKAGNIELSDGEMLTLVKHLKPEGLTVDASGWNLIFSVFANKVFVEENPSLISKIHFAASKNGDVEEMSENMPHLINLMCALRDRMNKEDLSYLRSGDAESFICALFSNLTNEELRYLDTFFSLQFENNEYSSIAINLYGNEYSDYLSSQAVFGFDDLVNAKGTDAFFNTLKGYIAGKCPALSYAIFNAK